jgi:hypothetical protein
VDLTKPLLAMFTLKGRKYTIEYEGLHMLCMTCGRFGHYKEGCQIKKNDAVVNEEGNEKEGQHAGSNADDMGAEGPWKIVHKQRRNKKTVPGRNIAPVGINAASAKINAPPNHGGSRFNVLNADSMETNEENLDNEEQEKELNLEGGEKNEEGPTMHTITRKKSKNRRGNGGDTFNKGENVADRIPKESKLATRGGNIIKGKTGAVMKRGLKTWWINLAWK